MNVNLIQLFLVGVLGVNLLLFPIGGHPSELGNVQASATNQFGERIDLYMDRASCPEDTWRAIYFVPDKTSIEGCWRFYNEVGAIGHKHVAISFRDGDRYVIERDRFNWVRDARSCN